MLKTNLKYAFRNLIRNKLTASINVLSLTIGISACLVIFIFIRHEFGFDSFQPDKDRIYRILSNFSGEFGGINRGVPTGFTAIVKEEFTGIDAVVNFHNFSATVAVSEPQVGLKKFDSKSKIIITSPDYFSVFNYYEWIEGSPELSLNGPGLVVLTASRARTYFGSTPFQQIIGREIYYQDSLVVTVSGIIADVEEKTDFDFTDFISFKTIENTWLRQRISVDEWRGTNSSSQLFIKASPPASKKSLQSQLKRLEDIFAEKNKNSGVQNTPLLQPLDEIHFNTEVGIFGNRIVPEKSTLQTLVGIALLLLIIAVINFINLETANASRRSKEVGVRKVLGSTRKALIFQFVLESFVLTVAAIFISLIVSWFVVQYFTDLLPEGLVFDLTDNVTIIFLILCGVVVSLLSGLYPAFVLSSAQPALALKNIVTSARGSTRSSIIRKSLTIFQFSFSQIMIVSALAVGWQISYMLNKDLGFATDRIIYFDIPWQEHEKKKFLLANELASLPEIQILSFHNEPPSSGGYTTSTFTFESEKDILTHNVYIKEGDTAYLRLYDIKLLAGRNLQHSDTAEECIINETYMRMLGFSNPYDVLGKNIKDLPIVGVVRNFHSRSLHNAIDPLIIFSRTSDHKSLGLRLHEQNDKAADFKQAIAKIESAWKKFYDVKFQFFFLEDSVKKYYEAEKRIGKLANIATVIAVFISCLGLFGLSSFTVQQRTKEIGIRKVLGASVKSILILLSKDFLMLVVVAFVLSTPLAYYIADQWLQKFAYPMDMRAMLFLVGGIFSVITALITISFKTVAAANDDPMKSLRYE